MSTRSEVVVLIPHYNNFIGLLNSINSINESFDIDVLIVDDGSETNRIDEHILAFSKPKNIDLIYIYLNNNKGIEHALNLGLDYIKSNSNYNYIARLDCGDLCQPNRFRIQRDYLDSHNAGIVGSFVTFFNIEGNKVFDLKMPISNSSIKKKMYLNAMFIHPTIMFKKQVLSKVKHYPIAYPAAEDYAFFFEVLKYFEGGNISQFLVHCELNPSGISQKRRKAQLNSRIRLLLKNFKFGFYPMYGLIRNCLIYMLPYRFILYIKRVG